MRAILTLAFLIVSLKGAVPEVKYQDQLGTKGDRSMASDVRIQLAGFVRRDLPMGTGVAANIGRRAASSK